MRVLHLGSGHMFGGVETLLVTLARLRDLCPAMQPHFALNCEGRLSRELSEAGVPVYLLGRVRISRPWTVWRARRELRNLLRREHFDIAICHMPWVHFVFAKAVSECGVRLAFWAHGAPTGRDWLELLARRTVPHLAIANSRFTAAALPNLFPGVRQGVVYPPVAPGEALVSADVRRSVRAELNVGNDTVVIVQVSRLEACKGHFTHLEALARLTDLPTPWECWMVGGPQRPEEEVYLRRLRCRAAELRIAGRIRFLGQRADVPSILAAADIYCQPNDTPDSFGISFIEALRAGCPVVTTAIGGACEIIDDSCGTLTRPGDPAEVAARLRPLIESPAVRTRLAQYGPRRAEALCDPAEQINALNRLLTSAIDGNTRAPASPAMRNSA